MHPFAIVNRGALGALGAGRSHGLHSHAAARRAIAPFNWQVPNSNWVLGVEADASWLSSDGTNTCLAFSGLFVSANCRAQPNMMSDLTARVGWALAGSITAWSTSRAELPTSIVRLILRRTTRTALALLLSLRTQASQKSAGRLELVSNMQ